MGKATRVYTNGTERDWQTRYSRPHVPGFGKAVKKSMNRKLRTMGKRELRAGLQEQPT